MYSNKLMEALNEIDVDNLVSTSFNISDYISDEKLIEEYNSVSGIKNDDLSNEKDLENETDSNEDISNETDLEDKDDSNEDISNETDLEGKDDSNEDLSNEKDIGVDIATIINNKSKIKIPVDLGNGDTEIDIESLIKYAKLGTEYSSKSKDIYKAVNIQNKLDKSGVKQELIDSLIKLKSEGLTIDALKDFVVNSELDLDNLRDNLFELNNDEIASYKEEIKNKPAPTNSVKKVEALVHDLSINEPEVLEKIASYSNEIPIMSSYLKEIDDKDSDEELFILYNTIQDGTFDKLKPIMKQLLVKNDFVSRNRYSTNNGANGFLNLYNDSCKILDDGAKNSSRQKEIIAKKNNLNKNSVNSRSHITNDNIVDRGKQIAKEYERISKMSSNELEAYLRKQKLN